VLACAGYSLLIERLRKQAPWPVNFIDPAPAIARRVTELLGPGKAGDQPGSVRAIFTSGRQPASTLGLIQRRFDPRFDTARVSP
jgi:glutamate racemase